MGGFDVLVMGRAVPLPLPSQRLLALLALRAHAERRSWLAGTLWPDKPEARAVANLRAAVWRLPAALRAHLVVVPAQLALAGDWAVDVRRATELAGRLHGGATPSLAETALFCADLLPLWDETWLDIERERYHQLRMHALDQLARNHLAAARPDLCLAVALEALAVEPLRETSAQLVLQAHLSEGNRAAAVEHFRRFSRLLDAELHVPPGPVMRQLIGQLAEGQENAGVTPM